MKKVLALLLALTVSGSMGIVSSAEQISKEKSFSYLSESENDGFSDESDIDEEAELEYFKKFLENSKQEGTGQIETNPGDLKEVNSALPSGGYTNTSEPYSFITIDKVVGNADTTCSVYKIVVDGETICGYGEYTYNLNSKFIIKLSSWYYYGTHNTGTGIKYISAEYSGGNIIIGGYTYEKD